MSINTQVHTNTNISSKQYIVIYKLFSSYGGKSTGTLSSLRYAKFMEFVSTSMQLLPENLPPTERALTFHAYRVHLQVSQWKALSLSLSLSPSLCLDCLNPLAWGWFQKDGIIAPVMTDK